MKNISYPTESFVHKFISYYNRRIIQREIVRNGLRVKKKSKQGEKESDLIIIEFKR